MAILATILSGLATIIGGAVTAGKEVVSAIGSVMTGVWSALSTFISNSPRPMKILIFMFLLVSIGNLFSNFFLGMKYACNSNDQLYEADNIVTGLASAIRLNLFSFTIAETDTYIAENYERIIPDADVTTVRCEDEHAKLFFYNIDLFSYKLWLLLMILIYGAPLVWSYYSKMGVLH
jgi:hypothetical protein